MAFDVSLLSNHKYPKWLLAPFLRFSETTCYAVALLLLCSYAAGGTFASGLLWLVKDVFATPITDWESAAGITLALCLIVIVSIGFVCSILQALAFHPRYGFIKRAMSFFAAVVLLYVSGASFLSFFDTTIDWRDLLSYMQIVFVTIEFCIGMALMVIALIPVMEDVDLKTWFEEPLSLIKTIVVALIVVAVYAWGHNAEWPEYITFQASLLLALAAAQAISSIQRRKGTV